MTALAASEVARQRVSRLLAGLAGGAAVAFLLGGLITPDQLWPNLLLMTVYLIGLGLGAAFFLAVTRVMGARWCKAIQVVPEVMAKTVPLVAPMIGIVVIAGAIRNPIAESELLHGDGFWFKRWWLGTTFFSIRTVAYLVLFSLFAIGLAKCSRRSRTSSSPLYGRLSALFIVLFSLVFSAASVDWIMALNPLWFSTMWGVYQFSGIFLTAVAAITLLAILLEQAGPLRGIFQKSHRHVLGILLVSFSCFWMYIWLSQYMLIWYANIPEETFFFSDRSLGLWGPLFITNVILNWLVPFLVLLPRPAKQSTAVLWKVAALILVGRWLDLYLAIIPSNIPSGGADYPLIGFCEMGSILGIVSIFGLLVLYLLRKEAVLPAPNA